MKMGTIRGVSQIFAAIYPSSLSAFVIPTRAALSAAEWRDLGFLDLRKNLRV